MTQRSIGTADSAADVRWTCRLKWCAVRATAVFAVLQWLPLAFQLTSGALTFGVWTPPNIWGARTISVGQWALTTVLRLPRHSEQTYMSANNLSIFLGIVVEMVIALLVAAVWTALKPRDAHPRLLAWLYTADRYMLAGTIFIYGWSKVLLVQFAPSLDYLVYEVAQHNPRDLLWAFMTGSSSYQIFAGVVEVAGGLMLLSRRTTLLGALLSLGALGNVLALDLGYDVQVKFIALDMFLMAVFAVAPYTPVLISVLLKQVAPATDAWPAVAPPRLRTTATLVGALAGVWLAGGTFYATAQVRARVQESWRTPLYGIWDVEEITRNGSDVPLVITESTLWRRFVFQSRNAAVVFTMSNHPPPTAPQGAGNGMRYAVRLDESKRTLDMSRSPRPGINERLSFAYALIDADHLELTNNDQKLVVRLARFDLNAYPLVSWQRRWSW